MELRDKLREKFISKPRVLQLIDRLFENPYISAANVSEYLGVTAPTSRALIGLLEKKRVPKEVTRRSGVPYVGRCRYCSRDIEEGLNAKYFMLLSAPTFLAISVGYD